MFKLLRYLLVLGVGAGGAWYGIQTYPEVANQVALPDMSGSDSSGQADVAHHPDGTIRVASFNIQVFGQKKMQDEAVMGVLAKIVRRFDIVAVQEIRSQNQDVIPTLLGYVNAEGLKYDAVVGPRVGRTISQEQFAYVFNTATIEVDPGAVYTVVDPGDRLHREPLVAAFRARGAPPEEAFTFSLINVHTDPDEATREVNALDDVYLAVRDDERGEDDIIMLGDFNLDHESLGELAAIPYVRPIISEPTNAARSQVYDNFVFHHRAVVEFTGNRGVVDLAREYGLTPEQVVVISDHFPIWAEFSVFEGGRAAHFAQLPRPAAEATSPR